MVCQWLIAGFGEANPTTGATGYAQSGQGSSNYSEAIKFDLRYPGQVFDEETQLNYNLHRSYDPPSGRYFQADPIGLDGGWNRFGYVSGDPLNNTDPLGLYESSSLLRALVPGQVAFDKGMTALENGSYGAAAISFSTMLGEQVVTAASFGLNRAVRPIGQFCEASALAANETTVLIEISIGARATRNSANQLNVGLTQAQAIQNLLASGYIKTVSKDGAVIIMTNGAKIYRFYAKSTGGGIPGAASGVPSASVSIGDKLITKLRFLGE